MIIFCNLLLISDFQIYTNSQNIMTTNTFCRGLDWMMWKDIIQGKWYLNAASEFQESFLRLHILLVGVKDLSYFGRRQNSVARQLGMSHIETARLVGYSGYIVVSTCIIWTNDGETLVEVIALDAQKFLNRKNAGDSIP